MSALFARLIKASFVLALLIRAGRFDLARIFLLDLMWTIGAAVGPFWVTA